MHFPQIEFRKAGVLCFAGCAPPSASFLFVCVVVLFPFCIEKNESKLLLLMGLLQSKVNSWPSAAFLSPGHFVYSCYTCCVNFGEASFCVGASFFIRAHNTTLSKCTPMCVYICIVRGGSCFSIGVKHPHCAA